MGNADYTSEAIHERDLQEVCHFMGDVTLQQGSLDGKRQILLDGLSKLIEADGWIWICAAMDPERNCPTPINYLFGGINEQQVAALLNSFSDTASTDPCNDPLAALVARGEHFVRTRQQLVNDKEWYESTYTQTYFLRHGIEHPMYAITPSEQGYSAVCLFRFKEKPPFSKRQIRIVQIITSEVRWLSKCNLPSPYAEAVLKLTPRLRSVLALLLTGHSCSQIAELYHLSPHTIKGYIRDIYRHFGVSSQVTLIQLFRDKDPALLNDRPANSDIDTTPNGVSKTIRSN